VPGGFGGPTAGALQRRRAAVRSVVRGSGEFTVYPSTLAWFAMASRQVGSRLTIDFPPVMAGVIVLAQTASWLKIG
jgi:hypothetical protein